jgi:hypothetical protein
MRKQTPKKGIGAANVAELERPHPDDALLPALAAGGAPPTALAIFVTTLLTDAHPYIVRALAVSDLVGFG